MGNLVLTRIDYRMVHGQVAVGIIKRRGIDSVYVVDDDVAKDDMLREILTFGMQPGVRLKVCTVEECVKDFQKDCFGEGNHLIIFRYIASAFAALTSGFAMDELNIGQCQMEEGKVRVYQSISISREEFALLEKMQEAGVRVYFQPLPDDGAVSLGDIAKKMA